MFHQLDKVTLPYNNISLNGASSFSFIMNVLQAVLVGLLLIAVAEAGPRGLPGDHVSWRRNLSPSVYVREHAFVSSEYDVVILASEDRESQRLGYQEASTYYGYENDDPIMVIATQGRDNNIFRPCFITTPEETYDQLRTQVLARNKTQLGAPSTTLNIEFLSGRPMSRDDAHNLANANPLLRRVCRRHLFLDTRVSAETDVEPRTTQAPPRTLKVLTFDDITEIKVPGAVPNNAVARRGGLGELGGRGERGESVGQGRRGERGEQGRRGGRGGRGRQGRRGGRGEQGRQGRRGGRGGRGEQGRQGRRGGRGEQGRQGRRGGRGEQGRQGRRGGRGGRGEQGRQGRRGERGE